MDGQENRVVNDPFILACGLIGKFIDSLSHLSEIIVFFSFFLVKFCPWFVVVSSMFVHESHFERTSGDHPFSPWEKVKSYDVFQ
jgi:hypothetical protein